MPTAFFSLVAGLIRQIRDITWPSNRMPPGDAYGRQGQQQQQQHQFQQSHPVQQLNHQHLPPLQPGPHPYPHQHPNSHPHSLAHAPPLLPHPQHANPYPNGNQQYQHQQHVQYVHPGYAPQHAQFYPSSAPQHPYSNYNGAYHQPAPVLAPAPAPPQLAPAPQPVSAAAPMSASMAAPMQFVDPSFLQQAPAPRPSTNVFAVPQTRPAPAMSPQLPRAVQPQAPQPMVVKASPKLEERRPPSRGTPKLLTRDPRRPSSSAGVTKSPATPQASSHVETLPLLLHVAEDCLEKANAMAQQVARSMTASEVAEHHKLVATGLGCLDVALKSNKLWPRLEARLCLRYTGILIEETTNITEAETTLTRGISVCEKVT